MSIASAKRLLATKIRNKTARVGIVGIGFVGSALARLTAKHGFTTIGFDIDTQKVSRQKQQQSSRYTATGDFAKLSQCDVICICVPTPLTRRNTPDLRPLDAAVASIDVHAQEGALIIVESSVPVGTTRSIAQKLNSAGQAAYFVAHAPERVDIGNQSFTLATTPRVVAGIDKVSTSLAVQFYQIFTKHVHSASTPDAAELTKLFENTFRLVNISLVHEVAHYAQRAGVDIGEVIQLAATKPFGFMPHFPGPGVGGHCIPVDPWYLVDSAQKHAVFLSTVQSALTVNRARPARIAEYVESVVRHNSGRPASVGRRVLLIGISYKPDVADIRESASLTLLRLLQEKGWRVEYHDPYIPTWDGKKSQKLSERLLSAVDCIIIATNHSNIDYRIFRRTKTPIIDTRNALKDVRGLHIMKI